MFLGFTFSLKISFDRRRQSVRWKKKKTGRAAPRTPLFLEFIDSGCTTCAVDAGRAPATTT